MLVGYARVSSNGQSLDIQNEALTDAGCEKVFAEKMSGRSAKDRIELSSAIDFVRDGDVLVVTRLDRLARSVGDLHQIIEKLAEKKVGFRCLNQSGVDTDSSTGKLMLAILGAVAQFENDIRRERQMEGIAKAKAEGRYKGRPATIDPQEIKALKEKGLGASQIAREMNIGRASVYRHWLDKGTEGRPEPPPEPSSDIGIVGARFSPMLARPLTATALLELWTEPLPNKATHIAVGLTVTEMFFQHRCDHENGRFAISGRFQHLRKLQIECCTGCDACAGLFETSETKGHGIFSFTHGGITVERSIQIRLLDIALDALSRTPYALNRILALLADEVVLKLRIKG